MTAPAAEGSYRRSMVRGVLAGAAGAGVTRVLALVSVPLLLSTLGLELYGVWVVAALLVSSQGLIDLGLTTATIRFVADAQFRDDGPAVRRVVRVSLVAYLGVDVVFGAIVLAVLPFAPHLLHVSHARAGDARMLLAWSVVLFAVSNVAFVVAGALQGLQRLPAVNGAAVVSQVCYIAALVVARATHAGAAGVLVAQAVLYVVQLVAMLPVMHRATPTGSGSGTEQVTLRALLSFGARAQFVSVVDLLVAQLPKLVAGVLLGATAAAQVDLAGRLPLAMTGFAQPILPPVLPAASRWHAAGDRAGLVELYRRSTRYVAVVVVPGCLALLAVGPGLLRLWVGRSGVGLDAPVRLFAVGLVFYILTGPAASIGLGTGQPRALVRYKALLLALLVGLLALYAHRGVTEIALVVCVSLVVAFPLLLGETADALGTAWNDDVSAGFRGVTMAATAGLAAGAVCAAVASAVGRGAPVWWAVAGGLAAYVAALLRCGGVTARDVSDVVGERRAAAVTRWAGVR